MAETTGIQALERIAPDLLPAPGHSAKRKPEYRRHGTIGLFGNLHVPTGHSWCPLIRETRTEQDMLENLDNVIQVNPNAGFCLVINNPTTHARESLVRYVSGHLGYSGALGKKGVHGILKSVKSRVAFLTELTHRIRLLYTPRHSSWLNQTEVWLGTLRRQVIKAMLFPSLDDLPEWIDRFIDNDNAGSAKPYRWTYTGRVLVEYQSPRDTSSRAALRAAQGISQLRIPKLPLPR